MKNQKFNELIEQAKKNKVETPTQKVVVVTPKAKETPLGIFLPEELKKFVKKQAAEEGITIKELITNAILEKYKNIKL
jgi:predicted DNA binding CopG/RHH family protein